MASFAGDWRLPLRIPEEWRAALDARANKLSEAAGAHITYNQVIGLLIFEQIVRPYQKQGGDQ